MPLLFIRGDITKIKADAIVNAANNSLLGGGGVDGAIHRAAGPELLAECMALHGCETGEAKITGGYRLPCKYVIHTVGPVYRDGNHGEAELLRNCYRNSLMLAEKMQCESVAFPAISTGVYGYPAAEATQIATETVSEFLKTHDMTVWLVFYGEQKTQGDPRLESYIRKTFEPTPKYSAMSALSQSVMEAPAPTADAMTLGNAAGACMNSTGSGLYSMESCMDSEESSLGSMEFCMDSEDSSVDSEDSSVDSEEACPESKESCRENEGFSVDSGKVAEARSEAVAGAPGERRKAKRTGLFSTSFFKKAESAAANAVPAAKESMPDFRGMLDESFSEMLLRKIDESGMSDSECYRRANIDRKLFSKIRSDAHYRPSKPTAIAFALALKLDRAETDELLLKAGYALSGSSLFDVIIRFFIEQKEYDIMKINEALFRYDQSLLGS